MFYSKKYDYVFWFLVCINVCQGEVASQSLTPTAHRSRSGKSERKRGRTFKWSKAKVDGEIICELEHLMLQI